MARFITESCAACGTCEGECPVGAISQGDTQYQVNADVCIDCGACEAACPVGAIEARQFQVHQFYLLLMHEERLSGILPGSLFASKKIFT